MNAATSRVDAISLFEPNILVRAAIDAAAKLNPAKLIRNPVIFTTEIVAALTTFLGVRNLVIGEPAGFAIAIAIWLWLTVLFATFAEAVAEGRGRARAESLRRARTDTMAKLLLRPDDRVLFRRDTGGDTLTTLDPSPAGQTTI